MDYIEQATHAISLIENLKAGPLTMVFLFCLGWIAKLIPEKHVPNNYIPFIVVGAGTVLYPLLCPKDAIPQHFPFPWVALGVYGFIFGVATWLSHHYVVSRIEDKVLAVFGKKSQPQPPQNP